MPLNKMPALFITIHTLLIKKSRKIFMCTDSRINEYISQLSNLDAEKSVRNEAAIALSKCGKKAVFPMINLLDSKDWVIRYRAAEVLGLIGDESAIIHLTKLLTDEKDHVRYMAAKGLGYFKKQEISLSLIRMLYDENDYVRRISAVSLGNIGGRTAYMALLKASGTESNERAKAAMKEAITKIESCQ